MKKIKKLFSYLCLIIILLSLTSCTRGEQSETSVSLIDTNNATNVQPMPLEYTEILTDYKEYICSELSDTTNSENMGQEFINIGANYRYQWGNMIGEMFSGLTYPNISSFGYVLYDINHDGVSELFLVRDDMTILSIFTLQDSQPYLLGAYWSRYKCVVGENGSLLIRGSSGFSSTVYEIQQLPQEGIELNTIKSFGTDGVEYINDEYVGIYFETVNGERLKIDANRFAQLESDYKFENSDNWIRIFNEYYVPVTELLEDL